MLWLCYGRKDVAKGSIAAAGMRTTVRLLRGPLPVRSLFVLATTGVGVLYVALPVVVIWYEESVHILRTRSFGYAYTWNRPG
jgi:hypothetical protein